MRLYLVVTAEPWENSYTEGIFSTREKAEAYLASRPKDPYREITETTLDGPIEY